MTGTRDSLAAKIREIAGKGKIKQRILATIISGLLSLPQRNNFKQMSKWFGVNETTVHNWYKRDMELCEFNRKLIDKWGSGTYVVIFDPSYLSKSGKHTPGLGYYWAGSPPYGLSSSCSINAQVRGFKSKGGDLDGSLCKFGKRAQIGHCTLGREISL
jgi:hypothetical protein